MEMLVGLASYRWSIYRANALEQQVGVVPPYKEHRIPNSGRMRDVVLVGIPPTSALRDHTDAGGAAFETSL